MADARTDKAVTASRLVTIAGGMRVHIRVAGSGPPLLMLHESPRSSASMVGLMRQLSHRFTMIAPDTPGYGWSDPLPAERPEIADYAAMLPLLLDALRLESVLVYAMHTGALIAVEAARRYPERFSALVADGYPAFSPDERTAHLRTYLPSFLPSADGTHATWLWSRVRDQFTAFPWHSRTNGDRLQFGPPGPGALHRIACDFLAAGDGYRTGYEAAFRHPPLQPLNDLAVPTALCFRPDDVLDAHRPRITHMSGSTHVRSLDADRKTATAQIADLLGIHAQQCETTDTDILLSGLAEPHGGRRLASSGDVIAEWETQRIGHGPSIVIVPDWPFHADPLRELIQTLSERFEVHVLRVRQWPQDGSPGALKKIIASQTRNATLAAFFGASAALADASKAAGTVLCDPWRLACDGPSDELPNLEPVWDGSHMTRAFSMARDMALYRPFWRRQNDRLRDLAHADPAPLHASFAAIAQGGTAAMALLDRMLSETRRWPSHTAVIVDGSEPDGGAQAAAARNQGLPVRQAASTTGDLAAGIADLADMAVAA
ncbi:MAG: alpha/beta hydrolase [Roseitalea sp.]|jgi:pimeloyl-ACP methyl ester carboxylesterase|nr:alpha/beta hydrolase [Roseitalea sp.]MBO6741458.1 alpha/beta hydrolase [Roseitalea sp.]